MAGVGGSGSSYSRGSQSGVPSHLSEIIRSLENILTRLKKKSHVSEQDSKELLETWRKIEQELREIETHAAEGSQKYQGLNLKETRPSYAGDTIFLVQEIIRNLKPNATQDLTDLLTTYEERDKGLKDLCQNILVEDEVSIMLKIASHEGSLPVSPVSVNDMLPREAPVKWSGKGWLNNEGFKSRAFHNLGFRSLKTFRVEISLDEKYLKFEGETEIPVSVEDDTHLAFKPHTPANPDKIIISFYKATPNMLVGKAMKAKAKDGSKNIWGHLVKAKAEDGSKNIWGHLVLVKNDNNKHDVSILYS